MIVVICLPITLLPGMRAARRRRHLARLALTPATAPRLGVPTAGASVTAAEDGR
ncbi:Hypothetical protein PFR_JS21-2_279 [Propionibacterium freudenreichii]|nr:Protein of unknown function [Propionibacterium freudenreichii]SBN42024.1 Hypothetical protein PFR_JS4_2052 [Propionibacterium freudenreichii]SCQ53334.1 Hypothetical protein PFR_JS21-1_280 [Propionibacterium freudenreichii]SCQ56700.1 Hypothetical protein PFR_JS25-1_136 [Propionibacterium freudenreichii]SCQ58976.1 Hypothetical protein PFR_JS21-2_279 [Propionibacterium freudenreichii]